MVFLDGAQEGGTSGSTALASAGPRNRTRTGGRSSRRGREVSGSAGREDYISHKPAGWAGGRRGAGVGDLTDRPCPRRIKVKAGAAAAGGE